MKSQQEQLEFADKMSALTDEMGECIKRSQEARTVTVRADIAARILAIGKDMDALRDNYMVSE
jgi:hypothetical protein